MVARTGTSPFMMFIRTLQAYLRMQFWPEAVGHFYGGYRPEADT